MKEYEFLECKLISILDLSINVFHFTNPTRKRKIYLNSCLYNSYNRVLLFHSKNRYSLHIHKYKIYYTS